MLTRCGGTAEEQKGSRNNECCKEIHPLTVVTTKKTFGKPQYSNVVIVRSPG